MNTLAFSNQRKVLCSSAGEALKVWGWDPGLQPISNIQVGWDKLAEMRMCPNRYLINWYTLLFVLRFDLFCVNCIL